jgi:hypothetical protein
MRSKQNCVIELLRGKDIALVGIPGLLLNPWVRTE